MRQLPVNGGSGDGQKNHGYWDALSPAERADLRKRGRVREYEPDTVIFREEDSSVYVLIIMTGWVKASLVSLEGHEIILGVRGAGDIVGERAALWHEPRSADVYALNKVTGLVISNDDFLDFLEHNRPAERTLLHLVSNRLDEAVHRLRLFGSAHGSQRLASLLLELIDQHGVEDFDGTTTITLPLSQEELAGWVNCSRETVARALRPWRTARIVRTGRRQIVVLDVAALRAIVDGSAPDR